MTTNDTDKRLHRFGRQIGCGELPRLFTYPFHYVPHQLCLEAAREVMDFVSAHQQVAHELGQGKMLGVLVVQCADGSVGYLAAYSGSIEALAGCDWFVPPIYDLLKPDGEFKRGEAEITAINRRIATIEQSPELAALRQQLQDTAQELQSKADDLRRAMAESKQHRNALRAAGNLTTEQEDALIAESQFQKAELKRMKKAHAAVLDSIADKIRQAESGIASLKLQRKRMSESLQQRIFQWFVVSNANGQSKSLAQIFAEHSLASGSSTARLSAIPPAGSGECCAPKLLQWAYTSHLKPMCMAEFWWGKSPTGEVRHQGHFYPACLGKCRPILQFMMQGLDVEPNPLAANDETDNVEIIWEDEWLMVVNKPAGLLTTPGKQSSDSLTARIRRLRPLATGPLAVHRLDMATSGLVLVAKDIDTYRALQQQFAERSVSKSYVALVNGTPKLTQGTVDLPMRPDIDDRPRQTVDFEHGKPALTYFRQLSTEPHGRTRIEFRPHTGRTHQIRVHASHASGLNTPIVGDMLYGQAADRLYLHAESLTFVHPVTHKSITVSRKPDF